MIIMYADHNNDKMHYLLDVVWDQFLYTKKAKEKNRTEKK